MSEAINKMFLDINAVNEAGGMDAFAAEVKAETITRAEAEIRNYAAPGGIERRTIYVASLSEVMCDRLVGDMRRIGQELIDEGVNPLEAATIAGNRIGRVQGMLLERMSDWIEETINGTADV